jgi:arylsulfatase A-like enzyme
MGMSQLAAARDLPTKPSRQEPLPNIVIFYADDLGYGDLESYGHPTIRTPNLTKLAREGQQWTQFYAAAPVCTPSRGSLMTGRLPARIGLEASAGLPNVFMSFSTGGLPHDELTLPMLLKQRGYRTGLVGKWHLGATKDNGPNSYGFDYFFGLASSNDHDPAVPFTMDLFFEEPNEAHWAVPLYRNQAKIEAATNQGLLNQRLTNEASDFIRTTTKQPLFLMLAFSYPHVPLFPAPEFRGHSQAGLYGDVVEEMDDSVGKVLAALAARKDGRKTLIIFTSDNGPISLMRENGGSAGPLRGGKATTWDGGMRVPTIFWGPGLVTPGRVQELGSQLDILATLAELIGVTLPNDRPYDGESILATLTHKSATARNTLYYYRAGRIFAVRDRRYKAHFITQGGYEDPDGPVVQTSPLIFDLWADPGERYPLEKPNSALIRHFEMLRDQQQANVPLSPSELVKGIPTRAPAKKDERTKEGGQR